MGSNLTKWQWLNINICRHESGTLGVSPHQQSAVKSAQPRAGLAYKLVKGVDLGQRL